MNKTLLSIIVVETYTIATLTAALKEAVSNPDFKRQANHYSNEIRKGAAKAVGRTRRACRNAIYKKDEWHRKFTEKLRQRVIDEFESQGFTVTEKEA